MKTPKEMRNYALASAQALLKEKGFKKKDRGKLWEKDEGNLHIYVQFPSTIRNSPDHYSLPAQAGFTAIIDGKEMSKTKRLLDRNGVEFWFEFPTDYEDKTAQLIAELQDFLSSYVSFHRNIHLPKEELHENLSRFFLSKGYLWSGSSWKKQDHLTVSDKPHEIPLEGGWGKIKRNTLKGVQKEIPKAKKLSFFSRLGKKFMRVDIGETRESTFKTTITPKYTEEQDKLNLDFEITLTTPSVLIPQDRRSAERNPPMRNYDRFDIKLSDLTGKTYELTPSTNVRKLLKELKKAFKKKAFPWLDVKEIT